MCHLIVFASLTIYNFIIFVLLVVPVNGHVEMKTSLTPPLITHTAATPMPVPKLPVGGDPILGYESRRGSNFSIDPSCYEKSPVSIFIISSTLQLKASSTCQVLGCHGHDYFQCLPGIMLLTFQEVSLNWLCVSCCLTEVTVIDGDAAANATHHLTNWWSR